MSLVLLFGAAQNAGAWVECFGGTPVRAPEGSWNECFPTDQNMGCEYCIVHG
jgi:hypothetical protein